MSVNIDLTDNYRLTTDSRCWRIEKKNVNEKGEISYKPISYHQGPVPALKSAESRLVRDSNAQTFGELLEAAERAAGVTRIPIDEAINQFKGLRG